MTVEPSPGPASRLAQKLILAGLILEAIEVVGLFVFGVLVLRFPLLALIIFLLGGVGLLWLGLVYALSYLRVRDGDPYGARMPTLIFGLLSLLSGGLIAGVLYLVAYAQLGDAERELVEGTPHRSISPASAPSNP